MKTISCRNYDELSERAAQLLADTVRRVVQKNRKAVIAIPGGRSIVGMLKKLPSVPFWQHVHLFMIDERMVDISDPESNYQQAEELLIKRIPVIPHPFLMDKGVAAYSNDLMRQGNHFDAVIVAAGEDGHIAGLFPHHTHLHSPAKSYLELHDSPKPPKDRITASPFLIQDAGSVILLFAGAAKQAAYAQFINPKVSLDACPAKLVQAAKDSTVFVCP